MSDTKTKGADTKTAPQKDADVLADRRDESGGLIDPPVLPQFEQRLSAAASAGDDILIQEIQDEYNSAREDEARAQVRREKRRQEVNSK